MKNLRFKALVEAHNLEQKALVPRIILSNNTIDFLEKLDDKFKSISIFNRLPLLSDIDNELYINYLSFWKNNFKSEDEPLLKKQRFVFYKIFDNWKNNLATFKIFECSIKMTITTLLTVFALCWIEGGT